MPSVFVLYIEDKTVSPHLELLRNVCEPKSKSRPHITVRYFNKLSIPDDYYDVKVEDVDLLGIGSFGIDDGSQQSNRTVFIKCQSDELLRLEHKPFFPTSQFHITLYDGKSDKFARDLLRLLQGYRWNFKLHLPQATPLVQKQLNSKKKKSKTEALREYKEELQSLFLEITDQRLGFEYLKSLTDAERLELCRLICDSLQRHVDHFEPTLPYVEEELTASPDEEKSYEMHLTPPELAYDIASYTLSLLDETEKQNIHFGDPAVGTGAFFAALLKAGKSANISSAIGVDVSPAHVTAARWRWQRRGLEVIERDYLHIDNLSPRNLILANPPYLRHQLIPSEYKSELRQRASANIGMRISGLSGQYVYFMVLSHKWMLPNAISAWLIPSEFMQTAYGRALRHYLTRQVKLIRVHLFSPADRQFENAETLPCVVIFKNTTPRNDDVAEFTVGGGLSNPDRKISIKLLDLPTEDRWRISTESPLAREGKLVRLGDLFEVRRGIATGANDFFVLDRLKAREIGIPDFALKPLLPKAKSLSSDIIESDENGYPNVDRKLCVLDCDLPIEKIEESFPRFYAYLKRGIELSLLDRHLVGRRKPWYKQEQRTPAPFLCTYMGKAVGSKPAIRFLLNKSKAIVTNTYLMMYPKAGLQKLINEDPNALYEMFEVLKKASHDAMAEFARQHAGGLSKIEPRELLEVKIGPVPQQIEEASAKRLFS